MLSLLIPIYNFDVRAFIGDLHDQALKSGLPFEILCLDDVSDAAFQSVNREIANLPHVVYEESQEKQDRAGARNQLFQKAQYEWLVFLDCDGQCPDALFIQRYISVMGSAHEKVYYGGRLYLQQPPKEKELYFHWFIGSHKEVLPAGERNERPYISFMTNNFMVHRDVYSKIPMDGSLRGYGHEDTLFAQELRRNRIQVKHIQNPLYHIGIEPANVFIEKSRQGIKNLAQLYKAGKLDNSVKLIRAYKILRSTGLAGAFRRMVLKDENDYLENFKGSNPSLRKFDIWKLALFIGEAAKS